MREDEEETRCQGRRGKETEGLKREGQEARREKRGYIISPPSCNLNKDCARSRRIETPIDFDWSGLLAACHCQRTVNVQIT